MLSVMVAIGGYTLSPGSNFNALLPRLWVKSVVVIVRPEKGERAVCSLGFWVGDQGIGFGV